MPNPKTIKEIELETHIKWLSKAITVNEGKADETTVLSYGYVGQAVEESLLSLLDEVEKILPEELEITGKDSLLDENFDFTSHDLKTNYNLAIQEVKKMLSDLREAE